MNLNTITEIRPFAGADASPPEWREGDSWLAGGTWLFSEPQPHLRRLYDLQGIGWEPLTVSDAGLRIAATCTIADLAALAAPPTWTATPLILQCCRSFLASFKIWNVATVGGNICMSLPAGPMTSLAVALEGSYTLRALDGTERHLPAVEFVTGNHENVMRPGELLTAIDLPLAALRKRTSYRRMSLTHLGRSAVLLVGTLDPDDGRFLLTVTAATVRPIQIAFTSPPDAAELRRALAAAIPDPLYFDDVHGSPEYRKHLTRHFAESIRAELGGGDPAPDGGDISAAHPVSIHLPHAPRPAPPLSAPGGAS